MSNYFFFIIIQRAIDPAGKCLDCKICDLLQRDFYWTSDIGVNYYQFPAGDYNGA
jgi:hypothetical protein